MQTLPQMSHIQNIKIVLSTHDIAHTGDYREQAAAVALIPDLPIAMVLPKQTEKCHMFHIHNIPIMLWYRNFMSHPRADRQLTQLGAELRNARVEAGLTQDELGARAGVSRQLVSRVESGSPRGEVGRVARVAAALGYRLTIVPRKPPKATSDRQAVKAYLDQLNRPVPTEAARLADEDGIADD
jgi:transcriptional regulator with XRE-family HTH domain